MPQANAKEKNVSYPTHYYQKSLMYQTQKGFTLIELLIVITIAAVMAVIALPNMNQWIASRRAASQAEQIANLLRSREMRPSVSIFPFTSVRSKLNPMARPIMVAIPNMPVMVCWLTLIKTEIPTIKTIQSIYPSAPLSLMEILTKWNTASTTSLSAMTVLPSRPQLQKKSGGDSYQWYIWPFNR